MFSYSDMDITTPWYVDTDRDEQLNYMEFFGMMNSKPHFIEALGHYNGVSPYSYGFTNFFLFASVIVLCIALCMCQIPVFHENGQYSFDEEIRQNDSESGQEEDLN